MRPLPNLVCPVCGEANLCTPARSGDFSTPCWCAEVNVDAASLAHLPEELRGNACLCRRCLTTGRVDPARA